MVKSEDISFSGGRENSFQGVLRDDISSFTPIFSNKNLDFAYPSCTRKESDSSRLGVEGLSDTPLVVLDDLPPNNLTLLSSDKADAYYESARSLYSQSSVILGDSRTSPNETTPLDPSSETTKTQSAKLMAKPHLYHDGCSWRFGPKRPNEEWVRRYCKKHGLIPSSLREGTYSHGRSAILKRRPNSKDLLLKLQEVVREYIEDSDDYGVEVSGVYSSWKESKTQDLMKEKEEKVVEFSLDFKFISYI
ncbi:hypothetical protein O1611_g7 [Lasiodiplodia mahajangana]|uniref:Uncharacterized protein n=1 Tax=Lasiodiplodia mahajangana TaxID=1108764 RepID=A0ACC2K253_9PEZI|nr:hypothetical protein O1611_g7 [Lasiodiplodia mahajangana]